MRPRWPSAHRPRKASAEPRIRLTGLGINIKAGDATMRPSQTQALHTAHLRRHQIDNPSVAQALDRFRETVIAVLNARARSPSAEGREIVACTCRVIDDQCART
jgi:hypothetical protein